MARPKNNNRRRNKRAGQQQGSAVSPVRFHSLTEVTLSGVTGNATVSCSPQGSAFAGLNDIADQFDLFRFKSLRYRLHPMDPTDTVNQGMSFYPDVDIQTQTIAQLSQSPIAAVITPFCGVPSRWVRVPRSQLKGMLDWYKCTQDAGSTEFEFQGLIQIAGNLSGVVRYEVEGVMLFKNPVSSALQFKRTIDRAVDSGLVMRVPQPVVPRKERERDTHH